MSSKTDLRVRKSETFIARMKAPVKDKLAEIAESDGVSMSDYIERLVLNDFRKRGVKIEVTKKIC